MCTTALYWDLLELFDSLSYFLRLKDHYFQNKKNPWHNSGGTLDTVYLFKRQNLNYKKNITFT